MHSFAVFAERLPSGWTESKLFFSISYLTQKCYCCVIFTLLTNVHRKLISCTVFLFPNTFFVRAVDLWNNLMNL